MMSITSTQLQLLALNARTASRAAFASADADLAPHGIKAKPLRIARFMAQVLHECDGLTIRIDSMNYRAERIVHVCPSRVASVAAARPYAHKPEALANKFYGGRMGNVHPGDGWRFIGRGLLQITGRESYERYGHALGIDLAADPNLAFSAEWCPKTAAAEWQASGCNAFADNDSITKVIRALNGDTVGLASRKDWLVKPSTSGISRLAIKEPDNAFQGEEFMNEVLAKQAIEALGDSEFDGKKNHCEVLCAKWSRRCMTASMMMCTRMPRAIRDWPGRQWA